MLLETRKLGAKIHKSTIKRRTEEETRQGEQNLGASWGGSEGSLKGHFDYLVGKDGCLQRAQHLGQRLDEPLPFKSQRTAAVLQNNDPHQKVSLIRHFSPFHCHHLLSHPLTASASLIHPFTTSHQSQLSRLKIRSCHPCLKTFSGSPLHLICGTCGLTPADFPACYYMLPSGPPGPQHASPLKFTNSFPPENFICATHLANPFPSQMKTPPQGSLL